VGLIYDTSLTGQFLEVSMLFHKTVLSCALLSFFSVLSCVEQKYLVIHSAVGLGEKECLVYKDEYGTAICLGSVKAVATLKTGEQILLLDESKSTFRLQVHSSLTLWFNDSRDWNPLHAYVTVYSTDDIIFDEHGVPVRVKNLIDAIKNLVNSYLKR
jgi:hypothetical protein